MTVQEACGQTIKALRVERGLSQEEFAHACEVDKVFLYRIESGINQPTITTLFKIANGLEIPCSELIRKIEEKV